ncbi:hypothetical protein Salat_1918600 [Sesamum alatum]|uniref:Uncharacterized protein n=1 Tax=Sesamum alatum TaxID=300844 RepID=A0AAE1Y581_9LAMI|nr:hypothetical protein Salat_1918600 [Sesamum alatum]
MAGEVSSNWTSSGTSGPSSPPPITRRLPQKIRGKMPRRSKASSSGENVAPSPTLISGEALAVVSSTPSQMSEESIRKLVDQISLPATYDWLRPSPSQFANNPPEGFLTVYTSQLTSGLRFPLPDLLVQLFNVLGIPPSQLLPNSYRLVVGFLLCSQLYQFEPTLENFLGVLAPKLTTGECFFYLSPRPGLTFIRDKPSSMAPGKRAFSLCENLCGTCPSFGARR